MWHFTRWRKKEKGEVVATTTLVQTWWGSYNCSHWSKRPSELEPMHRFASKINLYNTRKKRTTKSTMWFWNNLLKKFISFGVWSRYFVPALLHDSLQGSLRSLDNSVQEINHQVNTGFQRRTKLKKPRKSKRKRGRMRENGMFQMTNGWTYQKTRSIMNLCGIVKWDIFSLI